jgi:FkbM family methyltransferase
LTDALKSYGERSKENEALAHIQATSRLLQSDSAADLELWQTPRGSFWIPSGNSFPLFTFLALEQLHTYGTGENGVRPGDIVLDCGAHVGTFTREALALGAKLVVAIEPAPENVECLRRNFSGEISAGRVLVYPAGVWDRADYLTLKLEHRSNSGTYEVSEGTVAGSGVVRVPLTTVDALASELKLPRIDFIKLHVEGAERRALSGAQKTLAKYRPRLAIAAYHHRDDPQNISSVVLKAGPAYHMQCGPCFSKLGIHPRVLFFN